MTQTKRDNFRNEKCQYHRTEGHLANIFWWILKKSSINKEIPHALATLTMDNTLAETEWTTNTGASNHMTRQSCMLTNLHKHKGADFVIIGNGSAIPILVLGTHRLNNRKLL
jgi:hypothetical protein